MKIVELEIDVWKTSEQNDECGENTSDDKTTIFAVECVESSMRTRRFGGEEKTEEEDGKREGKSLSEQQTGTRRKSTSKFMGWRESAIVSEISEMAGLEDEAETKWTTGTTEFEQIEIFYREGKIGHEISDHNETFERIRMCRRNKTWSENI